MGWGTRRVRGPGLAGWVDPDDLAVLGELDGPSHYRDVDGLAGPAAADLVVGPGEADHHGPVGQLGHRQPGGGITGPAATCIRGARSAWS